MLIARCSRRCELCAPKIRRMFNPNEINKYNIFTYGLSRD